MSTRLVRLAVLGLMPVAAGAASLVAGAQTAKPAPAPSPLAPFKVSEAVVRTEILRSVEGGGEISNQLLVVIREGHDRIPPALRGAATTAAFAWAKTYVSSPYWARITGGSPTVSPTLIPLVIKNLKNPL